MSGNRLRLALDVAVVRAEPTGVGVYAASLARALARISPELVTLIGARLEAAALRPARSRVRSYGFHASRLPSRIAPNYNAWLQLQANHDARSAGANLVHYTNAAAPLGRTLPFVVTVHDLSVMRLPQFHPMLRLMTVPITLAALARAKALVVPSHWVRGELMRTLRVSGRRVVVVEHAASELVEESADPATVLDRYALTSSNYLVSVGTIEPRKNVVRLVAAFEALAAEDAELQLVLVGTPGWRRSAIERHIATSPFSNRIQMTGYLPSADVAALIGAAGAFCYVSTYEGYGLPVIEALALGAPVVTSNRTAMPQAAGGAAVLVDPFDVTDIARGIRDAMSRRAELSAAGKARAARRTWDDVASEHLAVYEWALNRSAE